MFIIYIIIIIITIFKLIHLWTGVRDRREDDALRQEHRRMRLRQPW